MMRLAIALVRCTCDRAKLEVLEGDLWELHAQRAERHGTARAGWRALADAVSIAVRHSRLTTPTARRRLTRAGLWVGVALMLAVGFDASGARGAPPRYTISATDPAGRFTLDIENDRVVAATMDDRPVSPDRLVQHGATLVIRGGDRGRDFRVSVKPEGGITWSARTP